jgi:integrase
MGTVYRKSITRPLPPGAEIIVRKGERLARWRDAKGKTRTAPITTGRDGAERIRVESGTFIAKYRDGSGIVVETPTGCRTEDAARQVLADLERKAERVRAGLLTPGEARVAEHVSRPIGEHVAAYLDAMKARGVVEMHRDNTRRHLERLAADCGFARLTDFKREALERWLSSEASAGRSARSRNAHHTALVSFCNWCIAVGRMASNPFDRVPKANETADPRRRRRAMSDDELSRLLDVARHRPLLEALTVRRGKRKGEALANVRPEVRERLEAVGRERALIYKTLVLTGLRKGELSSLTVAQLKLDAPTPHVELDAGDEKSREGNSIVVRADLADDLRAWLADRLAALRADALRRGGPVPSRLPADTPVFDVPAGLVRIFDRDLKAAGIPKRDDRGRTLDVHALRTTFGTLLSKGGVPLRTAQAAMRHSDPSLTANVYTDPRLLDVAGALDALPSLPLDADPPTVESVKATGSNGPNLRQASGAVAPDVAPNWCNAGQFVATADNAIGKAHVSAIGDGSAANPCFDSTKGRLTTRVNRPSLVGAMGFEPTTSRPPV